MSNNELKKTLYFCLKYYAVMKLKLKLKLQLKLVSFEAGALLSNFKHSAPNKF